MISGSALSYDVIYTDMQAESRKLLPKSVLSRKPEYKVRGNRMAIYLDGITGSHYEMCFRQAYHEIALHFQSTPTRSLARRQAFDPHLQGLSSKVGKTIRSGKLENRGWMRIWIELPTKTLTETLAKDYTELFTLFITETFPILQSMYEQEELEKMK